MQQTRDTRIQITTCGDFHAELFTQFPDDITNLKYPSLKMGKFRVRREDNSIGERYFISDIRDKGEMVNAIVVHDIIDKMRLSTYGIKPNYSCERIDVYRIQTHMVEHSNTVVDIHNDGITIIDRSKLGKQI